MAYIALYRKWRPGSFKDLIGQEHISRTISNAIVSEKIGHAYLFAGPRGTGKTSTAKIFAKALNCEKGPTADPCNECENCEKINNGTSMDVFEIDAASNRGIDEIRELRETVKFAPVDGRYKVYIIDEVHMLTSEAFNALLKTLEEPPENVVFILATTEAHKVPATIQSRCQRYDFKRITIEEIEQQLQMIVRKTGMKAEAEALRIIAVQADGGMRDALSILDQCSALSEEKITAERVRQILGLIGHEWIWKITNAIAVKDAQTILTVVADLLQDGKDLKQILSELTLHMRSIMIYKAAGNMRGTDLYNDSEEVLKQQAGKFSQERIMYIIQRLHEAMSEVKWSPQPRITVEVVLLSLCQPEQQGTVIQDETMGTNMVLQERIQQLEGKMAQMAVLLKKTFMQGTNTKKEQVQLPQVKQTKNMQTAMTETVIPATNIKSDIPTEVSVDGINIWKKLLETLKQEKKTPVLACVSKGEVRGMNDSQFFVAFKSGFLKLRTEKDDYRAMLEELLEKISGRSLRLICTFEAAALPKPKSTPKPAAKTVPTKTAQTVDYSKMTQEQQHTLKEAINVFGDNFIDLDK